MIRIANALAKAAHERRTEPMVTVMPPRKLDGQEPPAPVAAAMKEANVVFTPVNKSITHTRSFKEAVRSGARILVMTAFTENMLVSGGIEADFKKQEPLCRRVAELLTKSKTIKITTPAGTNLISSVRSRKGLALTGMVDGPGEFAVAIDIEANIGPVEGSSEGVIVADASVPYIGIGLLREPITCSVHKGVIRSIEGGHQAQILRENWESAGDPNVYNIAEIGLGLNPRAKMQGIMLEDEGVYGSLHIGVGTNITFGGRIKTATHYDLLMRKPTVQFGDGTTIMEDGELAKDLGN
jgi:leucyl aminopeptidase (aminopeptidase T)